MQIVKMVLLLLMAMGVGIGVWVAIESITAVEAWDHRYYWMYGYPLLVITSFVLTFLEPRVPLLWGIAPVLAQAVYTLYDIRYEAVVLPLTIMLYGALMVPCLIAAYVGKRLKKRLQSASLGQS